MMRMPLVARAAAVRALEAQLAASRTGRSHVVLVTGDPGIGKTRLIDEFRSVAARRTRWIAARGSPLAASIPFGLVAEALESDLRARTKQEIASLDDARFQYLRSILPSLHAMDAGGGPPSLLGTLEAFLAMFSALARPRPLVLALDDLHQADASTWELVSYLARNPIDARVLVIASVRVAPLVEDPELSPTLGAVLKDNLASEVRLRPFDRDDVAALASAVLGDDRASTELSEWLFGRTRGNPLFAAALLQELVDDPEKRVVPLSVVERVRAISATLAAPAREVLDLAAVLGHAFTLADVTRLVATETAAALDLLVKLGLLDVDSHDAVPTYDFSHPVVQEAIYEHMGAVRRRSLHERVARLLTDAPLGVRAYHVARAALPGDLEAAAIVIAAAREAASEQRHRAALGYLRQGLDLLPATEANIDERRQLLDEIAWHASAAGDHTAGIPALRALGELSSGDALTQATIRMRLSSFLSAGAGDLAAAEQHASDAVQLFAAVDPRRVPAAVNELAWIRGEARSLDEQIAGSRHAYVEASALGETITAMHALGSLGHALAASGAFAEGIATLRSSRTLAIESGHRDQIDWHTGTLADALACSGELTEAKDLVAALLADGSSESDVAHWSAAHVYWWAGDWGRAADECRVVAALNARPSARSAWALSLSGLIQAHAGETATATFAQAERVYGARPFYWFSAHHDWCVGAAALLRGEDEDAHARLRDAAAQLARIGATALEMHVLPDVALAALAIGDRNAASAAAQRARAIAHVHNLPLADALACFAEGAVASSAGTTDGVEKLRRAIAVARELGFPLLEARASERLGAATSGGERVAALADATRIYMMIGAVRLAEATRQRLRALEGAGRRASLGVGRLTPREREVVALVRRGLTSREVAERLQLSERTVESHLAHAYSKLGITGRDALTSSAERS